MTDHDAALRLDTALDSGRFDDAAFDPLFTAAATLQHLDDRGHATPSDAFRTQLRQTLFASPNGVHAMTAADLPVALALPRPAPRTVVAPKKSHRFLAVAAVLILLIGGMGAVTRLPIGSPRDPEPSAIPAALAEGSPATLAGTPDADSAHRSPWSATNTPLAVTADTVYRFQSTPDFTGLVALRTSDTSLRWHAPGAASGLLAVDDDAVYVVFTGNELDRRTVRALSPSNGGQRWHWSPQSEITGVSASADMLVVASANGQVTALTPDTGEPIWTAIVDAGVEHAPQMWGDVTVDISSEHIVVLTAAGTIAVLRADDGTLVWSLPGYDPTSTTFVATSNGLVVFDRQTVSAGAFASPEATPFAQFIPSNEPASPAPASTGLTPVAPDLPTDIERWGYTRYDLGSGGFMGSSWGLTELTAQPWAIGNIVAIPVEGADWRPTGGGGPEGYQLLGISTSSSGTVRVELPAELEHQHIVQLGSWIPPDDAPEQFVVVTENGMLTLVAPRRLGPVNEPAGVVDDYDGAVVELRTAATPDVAVISRPAGNATGLWMISTGNQTIEIHPHRLDRALQEQMATEAAAAGELVVAWTLDPPEIGAGSQTITEIPSEGSLYRLVSVNGADGAAQWVQAIDPATGTVRWEQRFLNGAFQMAVQADTVFMVTMHRSRSAYNVVALDAATGQQRWQAELAGSQDLTGSPVLAATESHLLVLTANGQLEAFDLHTGVIDFSRSLVDEQTIANSPLRTIDLVDPSRMAIDGQTLAVTVGDGSIMGVDLETGFVIWRVVPDGIGATAVYAIDGRFVALAHRGYAVDAPIDLPTRTPRATPLTQDDCTRSIVTTTGDMATPLPGDAATQMEILGIDRDSGDVVWRAWADEDVEGPAWALPYPDQLHLVVTPSQSWPTDGSDAIVCALDPATGTVTFAGDQRSLVTQTVTVHSTVDDTYAEIRFSPVGSGFLFPLAADAAPPSAIQIDVSFDDIDRISSLEGIVYLTLSDGRLLALLRED